MDNNNRSVAIKNEAVMGKQPMTLQEAKLLRLAITNVSKYDTELMEFSVGIKELAFILQVSDANLYRDIKSVCVKLSRRTLEIKDTTSKTKTPGWKVYPWMSEANYSEETNLVTLCLNEKIKEYVLQLDLLFTKYKFKNILSLKSYYGIRLYEILVSVYNKHKKLKKTFEFSVEELREMMGVENKYKNFGQFKIRVLNVGVDDMNRSTEFEVSYDPKKTGRFITHIIFTVNEVIEQEVLYIEETDEEDISGSICGILDAAGISNTVDQCQQIAQAYENNLERFQSNLNYVITRTDINNFVAYLITISKNDLSTP